MYVNTIVYVVTTNGRDLFSIMTRLSIKSLRISNNNIKVILMCDQDSMDNLIKTQDCLLLEVDELIVVNTPIGDSNFKNRFIKTKIRDIVPGKFLFLDSDTIIKGDISNIFNCKCDIAGAPNHSSSIYEDQVWIEDKNIIEQMNWEVRKDVYINGGVLFYNETQNAFEFAREWHSNWLLSYARLNTYKDQPSLNYSIKKSSTNLEILPIAYNAQILKVPIIAKDGIIWHYYSSDVNFKFTDLHHEINKIIAGKKLNDAIIKRIQKKGQPYMSELFFDKMVLNYYLSNNYDKTTIIKTKIRAKYNKIKHFLLRRLNYFE